MEIEAAIQDGLDHVHMLVDTIGKRPTGFAGERRAAQYLCEQLQRWGLVDVGTEPFAARSWDFEVCRLESGTMEPIEGLPIEFSASTPPGGLEAELLVYESSDHVRSGEMAGKIVLVYGGMPADEVLLGGDLFHHLPGRVGGSAEERSSALRVITVRIEDPPRS